MHRVAAAEPPTVEPDPRAPVGLADGNVWDESAVVAYAQMLAARPFREPPPLAASLQNLTYDGYRLLAFQPERTLWRKERLPFQLELYHRGYLYPEDVQIHLVEPDDEAPLIASQAATPLPSRRVKRIAFDRSFYEYRGSSTGLLHDPEYAASAGFAGFKVVGRQPSQEYLQELLSFVGSSYFRALSDGQTYGTSCRGLALDIGLPREEEFPAFRAFWIEQPAKEDDGSPPEPLIVHALLDSPSVAGAYRFTVHAGETTRCDVLARLFFRRVPEKVGLAPLSSMWMWGQGLDQPTGDDRGEVHDTDGLLLHVDNAWIWRPMTRQPYPSLVGYHTTRLQGFGLLQRQRDAATYNDPETRYEDRPSVWVEPIAGWTPGSLQLLEFPTQFEGMDNIAAWFEPVGLFPTGEAEPTRPVTFAYRISWLNGTPPEHTLAQAAAFRLQREQTGRPRFPFKPDNSADAPSREGMQDEQPSGDDGAPKRRVRFEIDFVGASLDGVQPGDVAPQITPIRGTVEGWRVERISGETGEGLRLLVDVRPTTPYSFELMAVLYEQPGLGQAWAARGESTATDSTESTAPNGTEPATPGDIGFGSLAVDRSASGSPGESSSNLQESPADGRSATERSETDSPRDGTSSSSNDGDAAPVKAGTRAKPPLSLGPKRLLTETWSYLCPPQPAVP